eukprot:TRINITY_DN10817_c0_g1_i2.p1 TRINITY_DN10817_c0_g1~~TRINITY_DN10817_c0_g1_i2.p1  ORF type:complete len:916 (+),score=175.26 TRINITY_DN10817_c0_g1_i2:138-2750(+)
MPNLASPVRGCAEHRSFNPETTVFETPEKERLIGNIDQSCNGSTPMAKMTKPASVDAKQTSTKHGQNHWKGLAEDDRCDDRKLVADDGHGTLQKDEKACDQWDEPQDKFNEERNGSEQDEKVDNTSKQQVEKIGDATDGTQVQVNQVDSDMNTVKGNDDRVSSSDSSSNSSSGSSSDSESEESTGSEKESAMDKCDEADTGHGGDVEAPAKPAALQQVGGSSRIQQTLRCLACTLKRTDCSDFFGDKARQAHGPCPCGKQAQTLFEDAGPHWAEVKELPWLLELLSLERSKFDERRKEDLRTKVRLEKCLFGATAPQSGLIKLMLFIAGQLSVKEAERVEGITLQSLDNVVSLLLEQEQKHWDNLPSNFLDMCIHMPALNVNVEMLLKIQAKSGHNMLRIDLKAALRLLVRLIEPWCEMLLDRRQANYKKVGTGRPVAGSGLEEFCKCVDAERMKSLVMELQSVVRIFPTSTETSSSPAEHTSLLQCMLQSATQHSLCDVLANIPIYELALRPLGILKEGCRRHCWQPGLGVARLSAEDECFRPLSPLFTSRCIGAVFNQWQKLVSCKSLLLKEGEEVAPTALSQVTWCLEQMEHLQKVASDSRCQEDASSKVKTTSGINWDSVFAQDSSSDEDNDTDDDGERVEQQQVGSLARGPFETESMRRLVAVGNQISQPCKDLEEQVPLPSGGRDEQELLFKFIDFEARHRQELQSRWKAVAEDFKFPVIECLLREPSIKWGQLTLQCKLLLAAAEKFLTLRQLTPPYLKMDEALHCRLGLPKGDIVDHAWELLERTWEAFRKETAKVSKSAPASGGVAEKWARRCKQAVHQIFSSLFLFKEPELDALVDYVLQKGDEKPTGLRKTWESYYIEV